MALTRKFLKALGIEEEKIDEIISAHGDTVTALKEEIEQAKQGAEGLAAVTKERDDLKKQVDTLTKASGDVAKVQAEFDAYKKQVETDKANAGKKTLIKKALEEAGANPAAIDLMLNTVALDKVEIENDVLKDAKAVIDPLKASHAGLFGDATVTGTQQITPPSGSGKMTKETFEKLPLMKRMEYINTHPEQQKELIG